MDKKEGSYLSMHKNNTFLMKAVIALTVVCVIALAAVGILLPEVEEVQPLPPPVVELNDTPEPVVIVERTQNQINFIPEGDIAGTSITTDTLTRVNDAWRILLENDFEDKDTSRWFGRLVRDPETLSEQYARSGLVSLSLDVPGSNLVFDMGRLAYSGVFICHFYDDLIANAETLCGVGSQPVLGAGGVFAGTDGFTDPNHYSYYSNETWFATDIKRTRGWHQARFYTGLGQTRIYIDDINVANSTQPLWKYAHMMLNNKGDFPPPAYFDDVIIADFR